MMQFPSLNANPSSIGTQAILNTRYSEQVKTGIGINVEQKLNEYLGIFFRGMISGWSDGNLGVY
jgi:hypothetical protein